MTRPKDILSKSVVLLFSRPARALEPRVRRVLGAARSGALKPTRAARDAWRLISAFFRRRLGWFRRLPASQQALSTGGQRWAARMRALPARLRLPGFDSKRLRVWAADARGFWVMHQGAGGQKQGAEPIQEGDAFSVGGREGDSQVGAVEKELRAIHRTFSKQVNAAARRLANAEKHKARRLYRGNGIRVYEDRIETQQGVAHFATSPVRATVHFGSSAEEPQVIVDALDFVSVLPSKPGKAGKLANTINQAVWLGPEIAAKQAQVISAARLNLDQLETERDKQARAAESRLEAARVLLEPPRSASSG